MNLKKNTSWTHYLFTKVLGVKHILLYALVILGGHLFGEGVHLQPRPPGGRRGERREDEVFVGDKVFRVEADLLAAFTVETVHDGLAGVDKAPREPERPVKA